MEDDSKPDKARGRLLPLCALALAAGAGLGLILERAQGARGAAPTEGAGQSEERRGSDRTASATSTLRSTDSLEDILQADFATRYGRLALWSLDASASDLEAMFGSLLEHEETTPRLLNMLMAQWARVDPRQMIAVTRGTEQEDDAWLAWGMADAMAAYDAAKLEGDRQLAMVLQGIGMSNPELALQFAEKDPSALHWAAVVGIAEGLAQTDPQRAAEFARSFGQDHGELMMNWAQRDPRSLLAWCVENECGAYLTDGVLAGLQTVAREHPERLPGLVASLPNGKVRRRLLQLAMKELASHDIDAALALVSGQDGVKLRQDLHASLGVALASIDAERSVELFRSVAEEGFSLTPKLVLTPSGNSSAGYGSAEHWVRTLAPEAPEDTMTLVREMELDASTRTRLEKSVAEEWMKRDEVQFAEWLLEEPEGSQRDDYAVMLTRRLTRGRDPNFESAMAWGATLSEVDQRRTGVVFHTIQTWIKHSGQEKVQSYFDSGEAPASAQKTWNKWKEDNR